MAREKREVTCPQHGFKMVEDEGKYRCPSPGCRIVAKSNGGENAEVARLRLRIKELEKELATVKAQKQNPYLTEDRYLRKTDDPHNERVVKWELHRSGPNARPGLYAITNAGCRVDIADFVRSFTQDFDYIDARTLGKPYLSPVPGRSVGRVELEIPL